MSGPSPEYDDIEVIELKGRIDSITCREIESVFKNAVMSGKRIIVADLADVNYVSSAGLRIFLSAQKELRKAGGEVCFLKTPPPVYSVFEISGFTSIFKFLTTSDEINEIGASGTHAQIEEIIFDGGALKFLTFDRPGGSLSVIGTEEKLASAGYSEGDVRSIEASKIDFAAGFAALGNDFENFREYFGECVIIDGNIFVYPALPRSAVDFMIHTSGGLDTIYHFLYGFSFPKGFSHLVSFEPANNFATLDELLGKISDIGKSPLIGVAGIFESKGIFGMRLKKVPLKDNHGGGPMDIFSSENFPEWIDYSIEAEDVHNLVVITGIAVKDSSLAPGRLEGVIPASGRFHMHGIVFDKKPFNRAIDNFSNELKRITTGMEPQRVLHLLGKTRIGPGLFGIVELHG